MPPLRILPKSSIAIFLVSVLLTNAPTASADDAPFWPQFHGPNRDNKSADTGLLKSWPEGGPKLLWTARGLGHGFASVSIARRRIYTAGNIEGKTVITALHLGGRTLWRVENGPSWKQPVPGARGTPTIDGERLYHESPLGNVVCLDAATGEKIWGLSILEKFHSKNLQWAVAESLLIDGDHVICKPGGPETALVALDKHTGRTVWKSESAGGDLAGYASCVLAECSGLRIILTLTSRALVGVNADTGELLFRHGHVTPFDESITMPIYHDGQVFISTRTTGSVMLKLKVEGDKASVEPIWRTEQLDNQHGGVILHDGYLYGSCHIRNNAKWVCLDWNTGREIWAERGPGKGSSTYADGMLYTMNERRRVILIPATPRGYTIAGQFDIPAGGHGPTWAHPVVAAGRLYIRHSDFLYVYDVAAKRRALSGNK